MNRLAASTQNRASDIVSGKIGPRALAQQQRATVAFQLTQSEAEKHGLGVRWQKAMNRRLGIATRKASAKDQLRGEIVKLVNHAEVEHISQREMTRKAGLSWGSFRRCRDGLADPIAWLPRVQSAVDKIVSANSPLAKESPAP
ncbi:MAG: hypothetical protein HOP33_01840 [Verrucomicrobia bacterium]|nr:hypothetical protein [Verrucomicrobiota bacterium]